MLHRALVLLVLLSCAPTRALRAGPAGDVLIVVLDDVAQADVDELSAAGWTPTIDSLAASGVAYSRAYANPVCSPSRRSLVFSTWYFNESGVGCDPFVGAPPDSLTSIAEVFSGETGLFGKWHLGEDPLGGAWELAPNRHGFDAWRGIPGNINLGSCGGTSYSNWYRVVTDGSTIVSSGLSSTFNPLQVEQDLTAWWQATPGQKLAVWSMSMPHAPFLNPPASIKPPGYPPPLSGPRSQFLAMLASCDYQLGRFLAASGFDLDVDLLILVGDNGTPQSVAPDPLKAKVSTFQRGVRVPFIMAGAGLPPGTSTRLVHLADALPTVCDYLGVAPPTGIDGLSLVGPTLHPHVIVGQSGGPTVPGDWAAVGSFSGGAYFKLRRTGIVGGTITEELYNLTADPTEANPLPASAHPQISLYLRNQLQAAGVP